MFSQINFFFLVKPVTGRTHFAEVSLKELNVVSAVVYIQLPVRYSIVMM